MSIKKSSLALTMLGVASLLPSINQASAAQLTSAPRPALDAPRLLTPIDRRGGGFGLGFGAGVLGGVIGGALVAPRYYGPTYYYDRPYYPRRSYYTYEAAPPPPEYVEPPEDATSYCLRRFRSYDPRSGTYLGYDGKRHPCP